VNTDKDEGWKDTMSQSKRPQQHTPLIRALIIGTLMLLTGLALGLKLRAPAPDDQAVVESRSPANDGSRADVFEVDARATTTAELSAAASINGEALVEGRDFPTAIYSSADDTDDTESSFADGSDEPDPAVALRRQELQYLQEVQPDNLMIPQDKSPRQLDALWSEFQHYHELQQRIDAGIASEADREQYYAIRMAKYEEEKALIELCNDVAANAPADPDSEQATLCTHMAAASAERLQVIEASIAELEQQLLYSARVD
jgi:hypothetical protein